MTSLSLPDSRRRFIQVLWLSAALHVAVIGLTRLQPQSLVSLPPELQVQLGEPVAVPPPVAEPELQPDVPKPDLTQPNLTRPAVQPSPLPNPLPTPVPTPKSAVAAPVLSAQPSMATQPAIASREVANTPTMPQVNIPQVVDTRYHAVKELDVVPIPVVKPNPVYPPQAEDQGVTGKVLLRLHLEADGSISQSEVISVVPGGVFGEMFKKSALDAVRNLKFRPAKRNGLPVRAILEFRVVFEQDAD